ncbi:CMP-N-acetylneuraminate-beta-galactosamide-alpha-2,3-sialyltransferase 1 [Liparis tanakae]|uniref:CMP-N-acetylneuraminate-beta-galactosamide-alpha-2,3-sialyltransferase 1 n=1 Tax=Liparis tanakae TaxID=230148 RepID=A0A4Z2FI52_9TELE|nr:CMP-N-acetylneuraminate-beta-galactosamide-alpha-2,3-sialyltransferase 1 [Liparis tanakae]
MSPASKMKSKVAVVVFLLCATGVCMFWRDDVSSYFVPREDIPWVCDRCLSEEEPLFMHRFKKFAEPFLSVNHNLSVDTFNWWKRLQVEKRSFKEYKETVNKMFQMIPTSAQVVPPSADHRRTCAVVGNSANLKKSHYGPLIDSQDVVIRMNRGRIKGYEADVGTRTTHHIMYPESALDLENTTHLVLFAFKILDLEWVTKALSTGFSGRSYAPIRSKIKANKNLVHVFGYGADSDGNWSHYWEELQNKKAKGNAEDDLELLEMKSKVGVFIFLLCAAHIAVLWRVEVLSYLPLRDKRSCACDRCSLEDDPVFLKHIGKFDKPFLSVNHNLSEDDFNWWRVSCDQSLKHVLGKFISF